MTQKVLHASGSVSEGVPDGTTVVGSGSVLSDGSDATYVEGTSATTISYTAALDPLTGYESGDAITLHIRLSLDSPGTPVDAYAQVYISTAAAPVDLSDEVGGFSDGGSGGFGFALSDVSGTIVDYTAPLSMGAWSPSTEADVVAALEAGAYLEVNAIFNNNGFPTTSRVYEAYVTVGEDETPPVELPCDTTVNLDLSTAVFLTDQPGAETTGPYGQYGDGVIWSTPDSLGTGVDGFPDFFFAGLTLDPLKKYQVDITFDPSSDHDDGSSRQFWLLGLPNGSEQATYAAGDAPSLGASFYNGSVNSADNASVVIGPGIGGWDDPTTGVAAGFNDLWFETESDSAVSAISIRKICTFVQPPLRQYPRSDGLGASTVRRLYPLPPTIQASNRRGPSAIL